MTDSNSIITRGPTTALQQGAKEFTLEQIELIKRTICDGATNDELSLFVTTCERLGLDPFAKQIFAVFRWAKGGKTMQMQVSADGFRLVADRSGKYLGQDGPYWCGPDGVFHKVWLGDGPPFAARVGVYKKGHTQPTYAVARFSSYAVRNKDGSLGHMWQKMPDVMIAKCAESLALRKVFPAELSGIYTDVEMEQENNPPIEGPIIDIKSNPDPAHVDRRILERMNNPKTIELFEALGAGAEVEEERKIAALKRYKSDEKLHEYLGRQIEKMKKTEKSAEKKDAKKDDTK